MFLDAPRNDYHTTTVWSDVMSSLPWGDRFLRIRTLEDGANKKIARKLAANSINLKFMATDCCYNNLIMFTFKGDSAKMASSES